MLEVQALFHSANFNILILPMNQLQGNLFSTVAVSEIDFTKPTAVNAALNCVACQRLVTGLVGKSHGWNIEQHVDNGD